MLAEREWKKVEEGRSAEEFHEFLDVFDKQCSEQLLQHWPHNLGINLLDRAEVPPSGKQYQLAPAKLRALQEFIDDNLVKGYIWLSKASCSAPVFFVKKKDSSLHLVVDF